MVAYVFVVVRLPLASAVNAAICTLSSSVQPGGLARSNVMAMWPAASAAAKVGM